MSRLNYMLLILAFTLSACGSRPTDGGRSEDALLTISDSTLNINDIISLIPAGMEPADSTEMFDALVADWISNRLLSDALSADDPDALALIKRQTEQYRRHLLADRYFRLMASRQEASVNEDTLKSYYKRHLEDFRLKRPILKGVYIKIDAASPSLDEVRKYMKEGTESAVSKIEKYASGDIISMEYFGDRWVDFASIARQFPGSIGNPSGFLAKGPDLEQSHGQSISILHIKSVRPEGQIAPYEFAQTQIREIYLASDRRNSESALMRSLLDKALSEGQYIPGNYDISRIFPQITKK